MKWLCFVLLSMFTAAGCAGRRAVDQPAPVQTDERTVGWRSVSGHPCYRAPDFSTLPPGERRRLRGDALYEVSRRWQGKVDEDFRLPGDLVDGIETLLLQVPRYTQRVVDEDYELCRRWAGGALTESAYAQALEDLVATLNQGRCSHESYDLVTQYIEVDRRWQFDLTICKGERITIQASHGYYTIEDRGDAAQTVWITAEGDKTRPTSGTSYPCAREGCFAGQLIARFVDRSGHATVFPVGFAAHFTAPAHGSLSFAINDIELYDNHFRVADGVHDFLMVEIRPAKTAK